MNSAQTSLRIPYGVADYVKLRHQLLVDQQITRGGAEAPSDGVALNGNFSQLRALIESSEVVSPMEDARVQLHRYAG